MKAIGRWFAYVLIGVLTAAIGELQYSVFIRDDWGNLFGSMFFNALYLSGAFLISRFLFRVLPRRAAFLSVAILATVAGLMIEWVMIGNSPWGNPDASQVGMAAYWACMVIVPSILIDTDEHTRPLRRTIILYGGIYFLTVLAGQLVLPPNVWRDAFHIWSVILGYLGLIIVCVAGYLRRSQPTPLIPQLANDIL